MNVALRVSALGADHGRGELELASNVVHMQRYVSRKEALVLGIGEIREDFLNAIEERSTHLGYKALLRDDPLFLKYHPASSACISALMSPRRIAVTKTS